MKRLKLVILSLVLFPGVALAQLTKPGNSTTLLPDLSQGNGVAGFITQIVDYLLIFVGILSVLFIIIGGFQYITSAGNDEAAARGKKTVINAVIGLVVIILAYTIISVIYTTLTGN